MIQAEARSAGTGLRPLQGLRRRVGSFGPRPLGEPVRRCTLVAALLAASAAVPVSATAQSAIQPDGAPLPLIDRILGASSEGFKKTAPSWSFRFPDDHLPHPEFRAETWAFYVHLATAEGREYSVHVGFYRLALSPQEPASTSAWSTNQVYRGYFSLTDTAASRFHAHERIARAAVGLSGAARSPPRVWVEDWDFDVDASAEALALKLRVGETGAAIDLEMTALKPLLLQGEQAAAANTAGATPFHFYIAPRLETTGTVTVDEQSYPVRGTAWFDRAWGELPIPGGAVAANRFVLMLDDRRELSCVQLHGRVSRRTPRPSCILIDAASRAQLLDGAALRLDTLRNWTSPADGARYPAGWRLLATDPALDLRIEPVLADQEARLSLRTWAGSVTVEGRFDGVPAAGRGYVELTGYGPES